MRLQGGRAHPALPTCLNVERASQAEHKDRQLATGAALLRKHLPQLRPAQALADAVAVSVRCVGQGGRGVSAEDTREALRLGTCVRPPPQGWLTYLCVHPRHTQLAACTLSAWCGSSGRAEMRPITACDTGEGTEGDGVRRVQG